MGSPDGLRAGASSLCAYSCRRLRSRRRCIPQGDDAVLRMPRVILQNAERAGVEHEALAADCWQPNPPRCKNPRKVAVRNECHVALKGLEFLNEPIRPRRDLIGQFAVRTSVDKDVPPW